MTTNLEFPIVINAAVYLNLLQTDDTSTLFHLVQKNRQYLQQWLPWVDHIRYRIDQEIFIQRTQQQWEENKALTLGVWHCQQLVGVISLHTFDWPNMTASVGYWLDEAHQGQGIMTQACRALIAVGMQQLGLASITISCAVENKKSQSIALRLGFVWQETVANKEWLYDHYVDHHVYVLRRPTHLAPSGC